jgi:hypothetical protein
MRITSVLTALPLIAAPLLAQTPSGLTGPPSGSSGGGPTMGTGPAPASKKIEPGSLEDLLDKALRNNADIRAAEAKVRETEAELNRVRHQVLAKVVGLRNDIDAAKKMLGHSERLLATVNELARKGSASQQDLQAAMAAVDKQKAEVTRLESDLQALTGTVAWRNLTSAVFLPDGQWLYSRTIDGTAHIWDAQSGRQLAYDALMVQALTGARPAVQAPMAERIKAALDRSVKIEEFKEEVPFGEALDYLIKKSGIDVPFRVLGKFDNVNVGLMKGDLPVGAWLQALEDSVPNVRFVVREYGILVTARDRVPDGAMTVHAFWKSGEKGKATGASPGSGMGSSK